LEAISSGDIFEPLDIEPDDYVYDAMKYDENPQKGKLRNDNQN